MWHAWERRETCTRICWESPKERNLLKDGGVDGRRGSEKILGKLAGRMLRGFSWLRTEDSGGL
jgi:hypothetical protein